MNAIELNAVARDGRVTVTIPDACPPELEAFRTSKLTGSVASL